MGLLIFFLMVIGAYFLYVFVGKVILGMLFGDEKEDTNVFIDRSTHTHFHVHTSEKSKEIKQIEHYIDVGED